MIDVSYWAFFGTIYLIIMSISDLKKRLIDDRHNFFMWGATASVIYLSKPAIFHLLGLIALVVAFNFCSRKYSKSLGLGDVSIISWMIVGFGILNIWTLVFYLFSLLPVLLALGFIGKKHPKASVAFAPILTVLFVFWNFSSGLYARVIS